MLRTLAYDDRLKGVDMAADVIGVVDDDASIRDAVREAPVQIPIIFITAHDDPPTRDRARRAGAVEYLRKPFDEHALIGAIEKALGRR